MIKQTFVGKFTCKLLAEGESPGQVDRKTRIPRKTNILQNLILKKELFVSYVVQVNTSRLFYSDNKMTAIKSQKNS